MRNFPRKHSGIAARRQRGAVLVIALIFLMLLTILAISASGSSLLQEKMVAATRNAQLAHWGAESALRGAEWRLWTASVKPSTRIQCGASLESADCYRVDSNVTNAAVVNFRTSSGWNTTSTEAGTAYTLDYTAAPTTGASAQLDQPPVYLIEDLGIELPPGTGPQSEYGSRQAEGYLSTSRHVFRITARSTGGNDNAVSLLQSTFAAKSF